MKLLVAAILALAFAACALGAVAKPSLTLVSRTPVTVQGDRFVPGERVVLTAMTGYGARRTALKALGGRFRASFGTAKGCGAVYAVRAVGDQGSRAVLSFGKAPVCVPPPRD